MDKKGIQDSSESSPYFAVDKSCVITGRVVDAESGVKSFILNDSIEVPVKNDGTFTININLLPNTKTKITLSAIDNVGNKATELKAIQNDNTPPQVTVSNPANTSASNIYWIYASGQTSSTIKGSVSDVGIGVDKIIVTDPKGNKKQATISGSSYSISVPVYLDASKYTITAYDKLGNSKSINCYLEVSKYVLYVNPNGGKYDNSSATKAYGFEPVTSSYSKTYNYTGDIQTFTAPYSGYYYIEACGGRGGDDSASGGKGGYVKGYTYIEKGTTLYVCCGVRGGDSRQYKNGTYYNGNGAASLGGGVSGDGGGATSITTTLRGNGQLTNYSTYRNEVLIVAGGGGGGSISESGIGGEDLYCYTPSNSSGFGQLIIGPGNKNNGAFAQGSDCNIDGGGGGGGWIGGRMGRDSDPATGSGGGASFINTAKNCIVVGLTAGYNDSNGWTKFTYVTGSAALKVPTRPGYTFIGWEITGNVASQTQDKYGFGTTMVTFNQGVTNAKAIWRKN